MISSVSSPNGAAPDPNRLHYSAFAPSVFGLFLDPGGRPRRLGASAATSVIHFGGRPRFLPPCPAGESFEAHDRFHDLFSFCLSSLRID